MSVIFQGEDLEYFKEDRFYPACVVMDEAWDDIQRELVRINMEPQLDSFTFIHDLGARDMIQSERDTVLCVTSPR